MDYSSIITIDPARRSGKPTIRGMRITVQDVLEYLAGGMTVDEILVDFPELTEADIRACLAFAADRERRLFAAGVKLLLDQNLSRHLIGALEAQYPGSRHVATFGLERAADEVVWDLAAKEAFVIVTKDADFFQRSMVQGFPPKVVWLTIGNCPSAEPDFIYLRYATV